jgi:hypothetical protein
MNKIKNSFKFSYSHKWNKNNLFDKIINIITNRIILINNPTNFLDKYYFSKYRLSIMNNLRILSKNYMRMLFNLNILKKI